ncbi:hypothetical protein KI387_032954, partial [Taxus chinensis]
KSWLNHQRQLVKVKERKEYQSWLCPPPLSLSISVSSPSAASAANSVANYPAVARERAQDKEYPLWKYVTKNKGPGQWLLGEEILFGH